MPSKEVKSNSEIYEIYLGTFIDNAFTWYSIKKLKDPTEAYKEFKKYVNTQLKYTDEELKQVWDTGRLDIELRQGNKLLNWVGIYSREVKALNEEEEEEAEKGKVKKDSAPCCDSEATLNYVVEYLDEPVAAFKYFSEFDYAGGDEDFYKVAKENFENDLNEFIEKFDLDKSKIGYYEADEDEIDKLNVFEIRDDEPVDVDELRKFIETKIKVKLTKDSRVGRWIRASKAVDQRTKEDSEFSKFVVTKISDFSRGHWGNVTQDEAALNDEYSKDNSGDIIGKYQYEDGTEIWIVTAKGGAVTAVMFPEEFDNIK